MPYPSQGAAGAVGDLYERELKGAAAELRRIRSEQGSPTLAQIVARAPRHAVATTTLNQVLRGQTLPRRDYYMTIVRVLLTYASGKLAPQRDERLIKWQQRWTHLKQLKDEAKLDSAETRRSEEGRNRQQLGGLAARVLETAVSRGEYVQLSPMASDTGGVWDIAFSPDGALMATGHGAKTTQLWDTVTQERAGSPLFGHTDRVIATNFSPDGAYLATGSDDTTVRLWDVAARTLIAEPLEGHGDQVHGVLFSPDGRYLLTSSRTMRLWDLSDVTEPVKGKPFSGSITSVPAFSSEGLLAIGHSNGAQLWDPTGPQKVGGVLRGHAGDVSAVAFSPDGHFLATGGQDVQLWDVRKAQMVHEPLDCGNEQVITMSFSPNGRVLAAVSGTEQRGTPSDHVVRLWDTSTWSPIGAPLGGHKGQVLAAVFSPDSRLYATGGVDGQLRLRILPASPG